MLVGEKEKRREGKNHGQSKKKKYIERVEKYSIKK